MYRSLALACMFLTRLPIRLVGDVDMRDVANAAPFYPVVGVLVGLAGGLVATICEAAGLPLPVSAILAILTTLVLTGALHEDGLADVVDGFGAIADRQKRLAIMRDSRLGTYGALALMVSFSLRLFLYAEVLDIHAALAGFITAHALSRSMMVAPMFFLSSARDDGLGHSAGRPSALRVALSLAVGIVIALAASGIMAMFAIFAALLTSIVFIEWQRQSLGGYTGDTLGATQQIAEIAILIALVLVLE
jgi:adenosylcobinamide-GDP ribazoletransferase